MIQSRTLLIIGAGGHGKAVAEAALLGGEWQRVCFLDDRWPQLECVDSQAVIGKTTDLAAVAGSIDGAVVAVGNNALRKRWQEMVIEAGVALVSIFHPRACVSAWAKIGPGTVVMPLAVVGTGARLGQGVIVNAGAVVDHDAFVEDYAHLGVGVSLAGGVRVGASAWLQAGCSAGYGVVIDTNSVIVPGQALIAKD